MTDHALGLRLPVALPMHCFTFSGPFADDAIWPPFPNPPPCFTKVRRGREEEGRKKLGRWVEGEVRESYSSSEKFETGFIKTKPCVVQRPILLWRVVNVSGSVPAEARYILRSIKISVVNLMNCSSAPFLQTYLDRSGKRAVGVRLEHLLYKKRVACRENQPREVVRR